MDTCGKIVHTPPSNIGVVHSDSAHVGERCVGVLTR